jgi:hypothetical protein
MKAKPREFWVVLQGAAALYVHWGSNRRSQVSRWAADDLGVDQDKLTLVKVREVRDE